MYRLVEENKLRRLIESDMIYNELCSFGIDDYWNINPEAHFPDTDEIETELNKFDRYEERDSDD
jgi:hypothetical protein